MGIEDGPNCPLPISQREHILLGHGSGGKLSHDLIARTFLPALAGPALSAGDDAGRIELPDGARLVVDCKAYERFAHHRHLDKIESVYCHPGDVPCLVSREPGKSAYACVPLAFLARLLERWRATNG